MAAKLFDPFYLSKLNYNQVVLKIDNLKSFEYKEFTAEFLANMKKEVPIVMEHVKQEFDWDSIEVSSRYVTRIQKQIRKKKLPNEGEIDWKEDIGERARRIWEWWRIRIIDNHEFLYFSVALRLVVLTQTSSCSVERVFSQLTSITDVCGSRLLEDMIELRMVCRCNGIEFNHDDN